MRMQERLIREDSLDDQSAYPKQGLDLTAVMALKTDAFFDHLPPGV